MCQLDSHTVVYIIDDDAKLVQSYCAALSTRFETKSYSTGSQFLNEVRSDPASGCLIVDLQLTNESGLDLLKSIRTQGWTVPAIVVSGTVTVPNAMSAVEHGVFSVLQKPVTATALLKTVLDASNAKRAKLTRGQLQQALSSLTKIERQVLEMMLEGHMNKVISSRLDISLRSVVRHRKHVLEKLGVGEQAELIREWTLAGLDSTEVRIDAAPPEQLPASHRVWLRKLADRLRHETNPEQLDTIAQELDRLADNGH